MDAADIPFFAALVFPGFFAIQTFFWATHGRKMSDVMRVVWSFLYSVPVFFGVHGFLRHIIRVPASDLPSPGAIAGNAADAPVWFLVGLYLGGALAGYVVGLLWATRWADRLLRLGGLDLRKHRDLLNQALHQGAYVDVRLNDGALFRGWPYMFSGEEEPQRFIYLIRAMQKDSQGSWKKTRDVLLPLERVESIHFLDARRPLLPAVAASQQGSVGRFVSRIMERLAHPPAAATRP